MATLVEVLARAFDDDPVPRWLFRGDRRRRRGLRKFFAIQLRHTYLERGEVYTTEDLAGAALWSPPGRARPGWRDLVRLVPVMPYLTGLGRDTPKPPGCSPPSTRRGPGTRTGTWRRSAPTPTDSAPEWAPRCCARCSHDVDAEGLPAYLESSKESNLSVLQPARLRGHR